MQAGNIQKSQMCNDDQAMLISTLFFLFFFLALVDEQHF